MTNHSLRTTLMSSTLGKSLYLIASNIVVHVMPYLNVPSMARLSTLMARTPRRTRRGIKCYALEFYSFQS